MRLFMKYRGKVAWQNPFFMMLSICILILFSCNAFAFTEEEFRNNTDQIVRLVKDNYNQKALQRLEVAVRKRHEMLLKGLNQNPEMMSKYLLPQEIIKKMPRDLSQLVEQNIDNIFGVLEIRAQDANDLIQFVLKTRNFTFYIHFTRPLNLKKLLKTGQRINITDARIIIPERQYREILVNPDNLTIVDEVPLTEIPDAFGPQKTIVILANFQDQPGNKPWTTDEIKKTVFTDVNNMYNESSYKQTTVVGDVAGWFTVALSSNSDCNTVVDQMAKLASDAAKAAGFDLSNYKRRVYMFPKVSSCGWAGLGTIGGRTYSQSWINGYNVNYIIAHELGHNLGLYHSHSLTCNASPNTGNCSRVEYGDVVDVMGSGRTAHFNAFQKERLGWLGFGKSPPIQTVTTTDLYTIDPYETTTTNTKALKILKGVQSDGSQDYYYIEFRQAIGFDSVLDCRDCDYTKGVVIHQGNNKKAESSDLLDMSFDDNTKHVALLPGQTFKDPDVPNGGLTVSVNSVTSAGAEVNVQIGQGPPPPPKCQRANPTLTITPSDTQWIKAGETALYTVTLQNNDGSDCGASVFRLSVLRPNVCMRQSMSTFRLTLEPGATGTSVLKLLTGNILLPKVYSISVTGRNTSDSNYQESVTALLGITSGMAGGCS